MAEQGKRLTARGRYRVREGAAPIPHEEGFRHALDDALRRIGWPADRYRDVRVEFFATIVVVNPGHVVEYSARLTAPGG